MLRINVVQRRYALAYIGASIALGLKSAWAASPVAPPSATLRDLVLKADMVFLGAIESFVFRGHDLITRRDEFNKDFAEDDGSGTRTLNVFVNIKLVLKNRTGSKPSEIVRVQRPIAPYQLEQARNIQMIFLAKKGPLIDGRNSASRLLLSVVDALPVDRLTEVKALCPADFGIVLNGTFRKIRTVLG